MLSIERLRLKVVEQASEQLHWPHNSLYIVQLLLQHVESIKLETKILNVVYCKYSCNIDYAERVFIL